MMPLQHRERRNAALQYRWFSTGRDTARLKASDHAAKPTVTSSWAAHSHQSTSSDTTPKATRNAAQPQEPINRTVAAYLKSP